MKKYSANYSYSNHNFVIQNLKGERIDNESVPAICILKNILQRGKPTLLSTYLQEHLGVIHKNVDFKESIALIGKDIPNWERIIRGDEKGNYYPAKKFFEELIPKYLGEYEFIQQLLIPEITINEITQVAVDEYANQQVDFFLPQAYLIIEIDGTQHQAHILKDRLRDKHTSKFGIETVRINTVDLEAENGVFLKSIDQIRSRIEKVISSQNERKLNEPTFNSLKDYELAYKNNPEMTSPYLRATGIIRFQLLILDLLEYGIIDFNKSWEFELLNRDVEDIAQLAIEDIFLWFENIFKLQKIPFEKSDIRVIQIKSNGQFTNKKNIKVDFSLCQRYTDEFQTNPEIIYVRTDYLDEYRYFKKGNSRDKLIFSRFEQYDYFKISTTSPIKYRLRFGGTDSDEQSLLFLLWNIFLQIDAGQPFNNLKFREGQLPIIANSLARNDTIGLLPTGSGKSVCYQLSALLQPAVSFVVCPIKSLMYDQKADLEAAYFSRIDHITSDDDGEDKERTQKEFGQGKYFFIFISPERFQLKTFREYFSSVNKEFKIAYAVIDEVHCLSEWGHDFRTSYLNLSSTIQRYCSEFNFLGLTATASINVLKDIQVEFGIKQENIKTPVDYTREELEFIVVDDGKNKPKAVNQVLNDLYDSLGTLNGGVSPKCGIIFTPNVNGSNGCYSLSQKLQEHFGQDIRYYSGSVPKVDRQPIVSEPEFDKYKKKVQSDFKENKFSLLTATKAFGMGVNKRNIYFTIHYGIPGSMESLYQEAGRAGRDKILFQQNKAHCYVLLSKSDKTDILNQIWERTTTLSQIKNLQKQIKGDINTNLFLFSLGLDVIKDEFDVINKLLKTYANPNQRNVLVEGTSIGCNKAKTEKAIYRLNQLGVIEDWTISDFFGGGRFEVDFNNFSNESIKTSLLNTIRKYDIDFAFEVIFSNEQYAVYRRILNAPEDYTEVDRYILILLQWSYDNFAYNRRQSLKNIYENCCDFADGNISGQEFKTRLENYFKFSQASYLLQHVAENPKDIERWFEVFYQIERNINTNKFITKRQQENLRDNLSRFLESYMYNTGLDLISGLLRLLLDDYENADGRNRLESSIEKVSHFEQEGIDFILGQILKIGNELSGKNKDLLAESLSKHFQSYEYLLLVYNSLGDQFSLATIIELSSQKLKTINKKIHGRFSKVG